MNYTELYQTNTDFRRYVDAYAAKHIEGKPITVSEALTHKIVQAVGDDIKKRGDGH